MRTKERSTVGVFPTDLDRDVHDSLHTIDHCFNGVELCCGVLCIYVSDLLLHY